MIKKVQFVCLIYSHITHKIIYLWSLPILDRFRNCVETHKMESSGRRMFRALYSFNKTHPTSLTFSAGDTFIGLPGASADKNWWGNTKRFWMVNIVPKLHNYRGEERKGLYICYVYWDTKIKCNLNKDDTWPFLKTPTWLVGKGEFKNCANLVAPGNDQHRVESQYPTLLNTLFL